MQLNFLRNLFIDDHPEQGKSFLSAASGLVVQDDRLFVVADDELHLGMFSVSSQEPGRLTRLLPGALPLATKERKAQKPDFEILLALPHEKPGHSLLAMGSGSTGKRRYAVRIILDEHGDLLESAILDLEAMFSNIGRLTEEINLEGAALRGSELLLFNRGNQRHPQTEIFATTLPPPLTGNVPAVRKVRSFELPKIGDTPLTVTDACVWEDGILLSTVAESTGDSYADGPRAGAAMVLLDGNLDVREIRILDQSVKIEGIGVRQSGGRQEILCVTDADDPETPASLFSTAL